MNRHHSEAGGGWSVVVLALPDNSIGGRSAPERATWAERQREYETVWRETLTLDRGYATPYSLSPFIFWFLSMRDEDASALPAEVADALTATQADRIAARLREIGVDALPVHTESVGEVRVRAADLWPERAANDFGFSELRGMVLEGNPRHVRHAWEGTGMDTAPLWACERFHNHVHQDMGAPDRIHLAQEREYAAELADALRLAYPGRPFIVTHITLYAVSFYQPAPDAPGPGITLMQAPDLTAEDHPCYQCQKRATHTLLPEPDAIVPELRWARCDSCGTENLLGEAEICTAVL